MATTKTCLSIKTQQKNSYVVFALKLLEKPTRQDAVAVQFADTVSKHWLTNIPRPGVVPSVARFFYNYFPDKISMRRIRHLSVYCANRSKGCMWIGELQYMDDHLGSCLNQRVKCFTCFCAIERCYLAVHLTNHCIYRLVTCPDCQCQVKFFDHNIHQTVFRDLLFLTVTAL